MLSLTLGLQCQRPDPAAYAHTGADTCTGADVDADTRDAAAADRGHAAAERYARRDHHPADGRCRQDRGAIPPTDTPMPRRLRRRQTRLIRPRPLPGQRAEPATVAAAARRARARACCRRQRRCCRRRPHRCRRRSFTPAPTSTPFILVESGYVALRTGPGPDYPLVAQLGPNIPIAIISRNPQGTWYEICCVNGFSVWVAASHVRVVNDPGGAPLVVAQGPPSPTPSFTPTWTPTVTPTPTSTPYPVRARHRSAVLPDGQPVPDDLGQALYRPAADGGAGRRLLRGRQV